MPRYRVTISSADREAMLDLVRKHGIHVLDHGQKKTDSGYSVSAIVEESQIKTLRDAKYRVQQHEDVDEHGKARQNEVGVGNRYLDPGRRPR
jgi:hypothetical protein